MVRWRRPIMITSSWLLRLLIMYLLPWEAPETPTLTVIVINSNSNSNSNCNSNKDKANYNNSSGSRGTTESLSEERFHDEHEHRLMMGRKKRFRTKLAPEQKEKMMVFAELADWVAVPEASIFCNEIGITKHVLKCRGDGGEWWGEVLGVCEGEEVEGTVRAARDREGEDEVGGEAGVGLERLEVEFAEEGEEEGRVGGYGRRSREERIREKLRG